MLRCPSHTEADPSPNCSQILPEFRKVLEVDIRQVSTRVGTVEIRSVVCPDYGLQISPPVVARDPILINEESATLIFLFVLEIVGPPLTVVVHRGLTKRHESAQHGFIAHTKAPSQ